MLHNKAFVKKTKKGGVVKVVREHYLRDDVPSGSPLDPRPLPPGAPPPILAPDAPAYTVIDANVGLRQGDLLAHPAANDLIVPATALEEVRHRDAGAAVRLRGLASLPGKRVVYFANEHHRETYVGPPRPGESPNDRNDRAVRAVAGWYARSAAPGMAVFLVTDDAGCRAAAEADPALAGVTALSTRAWAARLAEGGGGGGAWPEVVDLVAAPGEDGMGGGDEADADAGPSPSKKRAARPRLFPDHLPLAAISAGLAAGRLHQGVFRSVRGGGGSGGPRGVRAVQPDAWVASTSAGADILIPGGPGPVGLAANRAMDGDVVAVELVAEAEWVRPSARLRAGGGGASGGSGGGGGDEEEEEGAPATVDDDDADGATVPLFGEGDEDAALTAVTDAAAGGGDGAAPPPPPNGRVVGILRRAWRPRGYPGSLLLPSKHAHAATSSRSGGPPLRLLFAPTDRRLPLICIETRQAGALAASRIVVALDGWAPDSVYPHGHYCRSLGVAGDKAAETAALLLDADIRDEPFTAPVLACLPRLPWSVGVEDEGDPARRDMRDVVTFSVDPPGCTDIDDALHWRPSPGVDADDPHPFEMGVHIADVSHFVRPGTPLDEEAGARATSTYLVDRRLDMLPKPLTENICSLRSGVDRLTFSCVWPRMSVDGIPKPGVPPVFMKGIIRSRAALTYEEAQARLDDERLSDEVSVALRGLAKAARAMRARRTAAGALQLASPEIKFKVQSETQLGDAEVGQYVVREANRMVEEAMLAANCAAAEATLAAFPASALLRRHPAPSPAQFAPLVSAAEAAGFPLATATSAALASSLDGAVRPGDPYFNTLLRILATRCLSPAAYFAAGERAPPERAHYGLAAPLYTHFTSPIRRYADVLVHRLLAASIGAAPAPPGAADRKAFAAAAEVCNAKHRGAQHAGRASVELHTLLYLAARTGVALGGESGGEAAAVARSATPSTKKFLLEEGRVVRVRADGVVAFVPRFGLEGPAFYADADPALRAEWGVGEGDGSGGDWRLSGSGTAASPPGAPPDAPPAVRVFDRVGIAISVDPGGAARRARVVLTLVPLAAVAAGKGEEEG